MSQVNYETEVCRLCGTRNGIFINIFESSPNNECIRKIEAVVPDVVILRDDSLSKFICHRCVAKVRDFNDFKILCIRTQKLLKSRLPWMSPVLKSAPLRPVSPTIGFIGGPLAYPFGQKEPVVEVLTLSDDEDGVETHAPSHVEQPSGHIPPQVKRSLGFHDLSSPQTQGSVTHSSPSNSRQPVQPVWNGNSTPAIGSQSPGVQSSNARMGSSGRGNTSLPSHSFRSFVHLNQTVSMNQPGYQSFPETAPETSALHAAKRPCRQSPLKSSTVATPPTVATSSTVSRLSSVSKPSNNATSFTMPRLCTVATPSTTPRLCTVATPSSVSSLSTITTPSTVSRPSAVEALSSAPENNLSDVSLFAAANTVFPLKSIEGTLAQGGESNSSSGHRHSGTLLISDNERCDSTVKPAKPKPKPKSKKKPVELSEADINNIVNKYPSIESVKICGNTIIFTCTLCNKMLLTEEAIGNHECLLDKSSELSEAKDDGHSSQNQNGSASCYVELSSDEETSSDTERHICTICSRLFHSTARLQKHIETHS